MCINRVRPACLAPTLFRARRTIAAPPGSRAGGSCSESLDAHHVRTGARLTLVNFAGGRRFHNDRETEGAEPRLQMNITGIVVYARPEHCGSVRAALERSGGAEVHAVSAEGRLVVTVEQPDGENSTALFDEIARIDGVANTALVYHHDEPAHEASDRTIP